ncbi:DUF6705 family protein [Aquaticitalea lipolytica]|uniref:DUF6705 family protein n=1 Tax=Aquaticitalea lipolytica TaxID=1247562 RepID=UPI0024BB87DD|nr:DUF6705 family protein [Aquaticitalea lipolytica]
MKKILIILTILINLYNCKAQTVYNFGTPIENIVDYNNSYIKDIDNHHDEIVGVWKWEIGNSFFEITLQEFEHYSYPSTSTQFSDDIFGKYKYVVNGNTIAEVNNINPLPSFNLSLTYNTPIEYSVVIRDIVSGKVKVGKFRLTSSNTANLELWDREGVNIGGNNSIIPFSLPISVTLTKQ